MVLASCYIGFILRMKKMKLFFQNNNDISNDNDISDRKLVIKQ